MSSHIEMFTAVNVPAEAMGSHGFAARNLDWFRFWLKGEEDPDPAKAEQYARWRELRKLQEASQAAKHSN
jgi:hypothetical protein